MPGILGSLLFIALIAYLWGSIPSGYWMGKILRGKDFDIRAYGSHKTGATNVLRTLGKFPALIVLIVDLSKGIGPALLATSLASLHAAGWGPTVAGFFALIGHCYPVFSGFKGGRGVLTGAGALLIISPLSFLIAAITTFGTIFIWRYVSLGSITGCFTAIICGIIFYCVTLTNPTFFAPVNVAQLLFLIVVPGLIILFHSDNIGRLLAGKERKIGQKVSIS
ncbi:MAG TPA: glycerol-3-phosphate 1-O-acyltransferase PlsY [Ktedonobacteraceae bacterium]